MAGASRARGLLALALAGASLLWSGAAGAGDVQGFRFQIVTGDDSSVTRRITDDLYKRLVPVFGGFRTELAQKRRMVYITIGPVALRNVITRKCDCVVIAAFTSSQVWRSVTSDLPTPRLMSMTAIYAEPAPADQLRLIALLYRRPVRVAAIVSHETGFLKPVLGGAAAVEVEDYSDGDDINFALNRVGQAQVLLAMPDRTVYSAENFRNILLSTYRHNQAVIGFSADMVRAGALATTYSNIEHINAHVADLASDFVTTGELGPPQFPRYFRTAINQGVARSLQVNVTDEARKFGREPQVKRQ
ncbi:hypothetical protein [Massilia sp. TSP1-1-2]|uniref:hypothetical protein n=1 Tax=unclassified Massilia TaxID=2609279 RepID=UPI003CF70B78